MSTQPNNRLARSRKARKRKFLRFFLTLLTVAAIAIIVWTLYQIVDSTKKETGQPSVPTASELVSPEGSLPPDTGEEQESGSGNMPAETAGVAEPTPENVSDPTGEGNSPSPLPTPTRAPAADSGQAVEVVPYPEGVFKDPSRIQMSFVGDVLLGSTVESLLLQNGYDYPYQKMSSYLLRPDLTIADLETPITTGGTKQENKKYTYQTSPLVLPAFKAAGFDLVNLANNHVMDYGVEGLLDTFKHLDKEGIPYVGAGRNKEEAFKPVIIEKKGMKVAFLGFSRVVPDQSWKAGESSPGVADTYNYTIPVEAIKKARNQADLVVVIAHWGEERNDLPVDYQKELARRYIDAGADLIVASHPHVLQGFEKYKGKWIAYSLGNFIFTTNSIEKTWDSLVLEASCSIDGDCALNAVPVLTKNAQPQVMLPETGLQLFKRLTDISFGVTVQETGHIVENGSGR